MPKVPRRAFRPGPTTPGTPVSWTDVGADGFSIGRTGVIWSRSPVPRGFWVIPDDGREPFAEVVIPTEGRVRQTRSISQEGLRTGIEEHQRRWHVASATERAAVAAEKE